MALIIAMALTVKVLQEGLNELISYIITLWFIYR